MNNQEILELLKEAKILLTRAYKLNTTDMGWDIDYEEFIEKLNKLKPNNDITTKG